MISLVQFVIVSAIAGCSAGSDKAKRDSKKSPEGGLSSESLKEGIPSMETGREVQSGSSLSLLKG